jgi:hypothetical protein
MSLFSPAHGSTVDDFPLDAPLSRIRAKQSLFYFSYLVVNYIRFVLYIISEWIMFFSTNPMCEPERPTE